MADDTLINTAASVVRTGTPLVIAAIGETFTERSGVVNLALDGSLMLSALAGFAIAFNTQNILLGTIAAIIVGALIALIVAFSSFELKQSQVAVGFILTLLCRDLAIFIGTGYRGKLGLPTPHFPLDISIISLIPGCQPLDLWLTKLGVHRPLISEIPVIGPIFFQQDWFTYLSYALIFFSWFWIYRTRAGLILRSVGERPMTTFARGGNVNRIRYLYTALGGGLVGLAGATYTLNIAPGWIDAAISGTVGSRWLS